MKLFSRISFIALAVAVAACSSAAQEKPASPAVENVAEAPAGYSAVPLIPREVLFGNPTRVSPQLSPDGSQLAYVAPENGVLNLWVKTVGKEDDRAITHDTGRGVRRYFWAPSGEELVYLQDRDGDENWHVYAIPLAGGEPRDLTPIDGVQAQIVAVEPGQNEMLIGINDRDPRFHDVYRVDIKTGERNLEARNDIGAIGWTADHKLRVRVAQVLTPNGGAVLMHRRNGKGKFKPLVEWGAEDMFSTGAAGFAKDNRTLYMISSIGSNTAELRALDTRTRREVKIDAHDTADVGGVLGHPTEHTLLAVRYVTDRAEWKVLDESVRADFEALAMVNDGDMQIADSDLANEHWLVAFTQDDGPVRYYAWDRKLQEATFLFSHRPELENLPLAEMKPVSYQARDGLTVHAYLTLPRGVDAVGLPVVINPHGGPWARDHWGFDPTAQWLANRGYAVLQPNFRGSTGYGKAFLNAGDKEWGGKMQDDVTDGTQWLIDKGIADPKRICIMGGSYGGYATLMGLAKEPDLYACGIDIVGVANLITWMNTIPPYWKPFAHVLHQRVGNPETEADFLKSRSPVFLVDKIKAPLLIAQGANDPRVPRAESTQIRDAMLGADKEVRYVEYPDEGHGFARPENRLNFYGLAEEFLAEKLGGRAEQ